MATQRHDARYQSRGVSAGKEDVHAAIASHDGGLFPGAFCKIVADDLSGDKDHCLVMHADGAGTKASLAYLASREHVPDNSGNPTLALLWMGIAQDSLVMNLDDCACVGTVGPYLVSNTIGRNAKLIPGEIIAALVNGYQRMCDQLAGFGVTVKMTGGETADVGDLVRTIIVDSTVVARLRRDRVIDAGRMAPGDVIVGFSSTGQAAWETQPNSGIGANGLTSARHDLLGGGYRDKYPETYAPEVGKDLIYCGKYALTDVLPGTTMTAGAALLSPTRTYLPLIKRLFEVVPHSDLHGLIHCSGGGQSKIVKFGGLKRKKGNRYVKDNLFQVPPLFAAIQEATGLSWAEMHSVYNMGHRLEAIVPPDSVNHCLKAARECKIDAQVVGRVESGDEPGNEVVIRTKMGEFKYR